MAEKVDRIERKMSFSDVQQRVAQMEREHELAPVCLERRVVVRLHFSTKDVPTHRPVNTMPTLSLRQVVVDSFYEAPKLSAKK